MIRDRPPKEGRVAEILDDVAVKTGLEQALRIALGGREDRFQPSTVVARAARQGFQVHHPEQGRPFHADIHGAGSLRSSPSTRSAFL